VATRPWIIVMPPIIVEGAVGVSKSWTRLVNGR
jgi:hypothetical protein